MPHELHADHQQELVRQRFVARRGEKQVLRHDERDQASNALQPDEQEARQQELPTHHVEHEVRVACDHGAVCRRLGCAQYAVGDQCGVRAYRVAVYQTSISLPIFQLLQ